MKRSRTRRDWLIHVVTTEEHGASWMCTRQFELIETDMMSGTSCTGTTDGSGQKSHLSMHEGDASSFGSRCSSSCRRSLFPESREG